ncbi:hypothetical protein FPFC_030470 [Fructobacillus pseudoficulneus]|uniref:DUF3021 domain-containing protein n=1 Tax=Fructobacillus pseudoficulneus TaxID=220714 RepID=A0A3F3GXG8_9LACO|nr:DUF3021 family protein [Fructobacillus pseudoficulneus]GAP02867.1 hypothetical protein FPFC_030470 [Fructobacillus pseudoficulneus]SEH45570.1 Protein of unknown function [Fructobacillus pseudoficulneus]
MRQILLKAITGLEYGSLTYLLVLLFFGGGIVIRSQDIVAILVMSAAIGILGLLFNIDRLSYLLALVLHLLGTMVLVSLTEYWTDAFHGNLANYRFWLLFFSCYVVVWIVIKTKQVLQIEKINTALSKRNR